MEKKRATLLISGKVQGVSYRISSVEAARNLGLTGYARNLSDGRVEIVAEGPPDALVALEQWCRKGPPAARVTSVEASRESASGEFSGFSVG